MFRVLLIYLLLGAGLFALPAPDNEANKPPRSALSTSYCPVVPMPDLVEKQSISNRMFRLR